MEPKSVGVFGYASIALTKIGFIYNTLKGIVGIYKQLCKSKLNEKLKLAMGPLLAETNIGDIIVLSTRHLLSV